MIVSLSFVPYGYILSCVYRRQYILLLHISLQLSLVICNCCFISLLYSYVRFQISNIVHYTVSGLPGSWNRSVPAYEPIVNYTKGICIVCYIGIYCCEYTRTLRYRYLDKFSIPSCLFSGLFPIVSRICSAIIDTLHKGFHTLQCICT